MTIKTSQYKENDMCVMVCLLDYWGNDGKRFEACLESCEQLGEPLDPETRCIDGVEMFRVIKDDKPTDEWEFYELTMCENGLIYRRKMGVGHDD